MDLALGYVLHREYYYYLVLAYKKPMDSLGEVFKEILQRVLCDVQLLSAI